MRWVTRLFRRDQLERELDAELRFHVNEETRRLIASGLAPEDARRQAGASFGGIETAKELARDARGTRWLDDLWHDLRYAGRMMRANPAFTLAAVASLAVGIGANAAIFSVSDALLLRSLPIARPHEIVFLNRTNYAEPNLRFSYLAFQRFEATGAGASWAAMSGAGRMQASLARGAELVTGQLVSGNWFDVLGVPAAAGRVLTPDDTRTIGREPVAVLSHAFWTRQFGLDRSVIGTTLRLNGTPVTIVGISSAGFDGLTVGQPVDVWLPVTLQHEVKYAGNASIDNADGRQPWLPQQGIQWLTVVARIQPPATVGGVGARIDSVHRQNLERLIAQIADPERRTFRMREHIELLGGARGLSHLRDTFSRPLGVLMGTVALVLFIACANLASLLLARSAARSREFALRLSLGAKPGRIVRQLLTESLALACLGGLVGLGLARLGAAALLRMASSGATPIPLDLPVDWRLMGFTLAVSLVTGVLFGVVPALRLSRTDLNDALKTGGRVVHATDARGGFPLGRALVVVQVALSLTLVVGAVLFLRTFRNLLTVETGFDPDRVVSARFNPQLAGFSEEQLPALYERLLDRARRIPGARSASLALSGALTGSARVSSIVIEGRPARPDIDEEVREEFVGPEYFSTVGMTLLRGRAFGPHDDGHAPKVAVANESMARHFFGDANPIGLRVGDDTPPDVEIVGVVSDAKVDGLRQPTPPMLYYPLAQHPEEFARNLYVRMAGPADAVKRELAAAVVAADRNLAVSEIVTLAELTERTVARERLVSALTASFGLLALAVACLGLYGTVSYSVARRTNELGVRLALGASPASVRWLVLRETLLLVAIGSAAGLALALPTLKYIATLLYGLSPRDPATLAGATIVLVLVGALAGAMPAWRASRVDPLTALRSE